MPMEETLREKINHVLDVFDSYQMTEEQQKRILLNGLDFDFTWGDPDPSHRNQYLDCFEAADFLETCRDMGINLDISDLLRNSSDSKYEKLLGVIGVAKEFRGNTKQKNRKP